MSYTLTFETSDEAKNWALEFLRRTCQAVVTFPPVMTALTPGELRMEHAPHLSASGLGKRLSHPDCPWFARRCSEGGRLLEITPNPELLAWLAKPAQDGKRLATSNDELRILNVEWGKSGKGTR